MFCILFEHPIPQPADSSFRPTIISTTYRFPNRQLYWFPKIRIYHQSTLSIQLHWFILIPKSAHTLHTWFPNQANQTNFQQLSTSSQTGVFLFFFSLPNTHTIISAQLCSAIITRIPIWIIQAFCSLCVSFESESSFLFCFLSFHFLLVHFPHCLHQHTFVIESFATCHIISVHISPHIKAFFHFWVCFSTNFSHFDTTSQMEAQNKIVVLHFSL